ncbi:DUF5110 domain-containing protein, partial [candidate division KSB1 bacterium]|nr:DUF5110 domain-containing protein [candidate division KSB1 bacterium]
KAAVYLPAGEWIDYWQGGRHSGPGNISVNVAREDIPVFVKAGAVIPQAPVGAYVDDPAAIDKLLIVCFPGADGDCELYEDDGLTYAYENGAFCTTTFQQRRYEDAAALEIAPRQGGFSPPVRDYLAVFKFLRQEPDSVLLDGASLHRSDLKEDIASGTWSFDQAMRQCTIRLPDDGGGHSILLHFSPDLIAPQVDTVSCTVDTVVWVYFSEPVLPGGGEGGAENIDHYRISGGVEIYGTTLGADQTSARLRTSAHETERTYSLTIAHIYDQSTNQNVLPTTTRTYTYSAPKTYVQIFQHGVDGYAGCQDTHIAENFPDHNMGGYAYFEACRYAGNLDFDDKYGLVRFDLSGFDPADSLVGAQIELTLAETRNGASAKTLGCYRVLKSWEEGDNNAGIDGAPAGIGEVTWNSAMHQFIAWQQPGGDIDPSPVSQALVGASVGVGYSWEILPLLKFWLGRPDSNFGVLFREPQVSNTNGTKVFYAHEHPQAATRPRLLLTLKKRSTEVAQQPEKLTVQPGEFILNPVHPNPFNATTTVSFYLAQEARVLLDIYSVNGQLIERLMDEKKPAGRHRAEWRADNRPSGLYLILLKSDRYSRTQKCLLLK